MPPSVSGAQWRAHRAVEARGVPAERRRQVRKAVVVIGVTGAAAVAVVVVGGVLRARREGHGAHGRAHPDAVPARARAHERLGGLGRVGGAAHAAAAASGGAGARGGGARAVAIARAAEVLASGSRLRRDQQQQHTMKCG